MDLNKLLKEQCEEKSCFDRLEINYLRDVDVEVCNYVISQLINFDSENIYFGKKLSLKETIEMSLDEMSIFGVGVYMKVNELIAQTPISMVSDNVFQFGTSVCYDYSYDGTIIHNFGKVDRYIVPNKLYEISGYLFSHEHIHALKDTDFNEFVECKTLGETLPLLYEFIAYNPDEVIKREVIKFRMISLLNNKKDYLYFYELYQSGRFCELIFDDIMNNERIKLFEFIRTKIGCYLNSFYYALILYVMYKESPKKILNLVSKVLKHNMTTLQMLNYLGIYGDIRGELFEKELGNVRKLLK